MLDSVQSILDEYSELERRLADPAVHGDQDLVRSFNKRYAALAPTVAAARSWQAAVDDLGTARELATEDEAFAAEVPSLEQREALAEEHLRRMLLPRDPDDDRDVILEVKAGEGGDESALFAGDLLRMYLRYAEQRGWRTVVEDATESDLGGYKDVRVSIRAKGTPGPSEGPWARLKYEGGVHRVQRVPVTESQGRIHTSAAGVLVMPEAEEVEVTIDPNDLRIDVYRSSGPGGQSVNTTDSAVRITHLPTGARRLVPEREVAAAEQGGRDCASCGPACTSSRRTRPTPRRPRRVARRFAPSTAPSGSGPTTSPRTASPTTAPATSRTTWTPCSTVASTRSCSRHSTPTRQPSSPPSPARASEPS